MGVQRNQGTVQGERAGVDGARVDGGWGKKIIHAFSVAEIGRKRKGSPRVPASRRAGKMPNRSWLTEQRETPMLTLYFSPGSSAMATHIALHEVGAQFEAKYVALQAKENRVPDYLALNPEGKVPTLVIDGQVLTEVAGTLYYIGRRFPEAKLFPAGNIDAEAQVISWMSFIASTIHPARRAGPARLHEVFAIAEQKLAGRAGQLAITRLPTSICSGCSGAGWMPADRRRELFRPSAPITSA